MGRLFQFCLKQQSGEVCIIAASELHCLWIDPEVCMEFHTFMPHSCVVPLGFPVFFQKHNSNISGYATLPVALNKSVWVCVHGALRCPEVYFCLAPTVSDIDYGSTTTLTRIKLLKVSE